MKCTVCFGQLLGPDESYTGFVQRREQLLRQHAPGPIGELHAAISDRLELLARSHPFRSGDAEPCVQLLVQAGDTHLEELIEVPGVDREELHPF